MNTETPNTKPHGDALLDALAQRSTGADRSELTDRAAMVESLTDALADVYRLYFKAQVFHWNVTGPHFRPLHELFEEQYTDIAEALDTIAERIRALGGETPTNLEALLARAAIGAVNDLPDSNGMLRILANDHRMVAMNMKLACEKASESSDEGTLDLLGARIRMHEHHAWMCESSMA